MNAALAPLFLVLLPQTTDDPWEPRNSGSQASLRGLSAVDERVCWASGSGGTVLRTVDGRTFEPRPVAGAEELDFRDVHAFDAERAVVLSAGTPARVYRTDNGGADWQLAFEHPDERAFFDAMAFWDERRGLAFSDPIDGKLVVIRTADGGRTWTPLPPDAFPDSPEGEAGFAASGTCLAVGADGEAWIGLGGTAGARLFRTGDGGATWSTHATPLAQGLPSAGVFSLALLDAGRGVAVGGDYATPEATAANAATTADGGRTWAPAETPPRGYRSCVVTVDVAGASQLLAAGPTGTDVSLDAGRTWTAHSEVGWHVLAVGGDGAVWAAGSDGRIARLARHTGEDADDETEER
ncbi:MAG: oxidoreductase [Planctomycetota bacterium]